MEAHAGKLYHFGFGKCVTRSNFSKANEQCNYRIFEEYATFMIAEASKRRINKIFELDYRKRWSVELFFKWIKQHLWIKKLWSTLENAVRIQIYCAIITYSFATIVQHNMKLERSVYDVLQILGIYLIDKTYLSDLFDKLNFKNVKDRYDSSEPNLFNFNLVHFSVQ